MSSQKWVVLGREIRVCYDVDMGLNIDVEMDNGMDITMTMDMAMNNKTMILNPNKRTI